ncbi:dolichyl-phosphate-mannose-protein mannosyltransferase PMT1 KNAG_0A05720 [Huiozyma naganishii CBS 8797]|uniref:Dolichyl-phosphate-mannose--protein mannosyltransferase n=1 Tax=Huiozyma naganishii (strain ATCC MYA-139 / BCRC 22969 / CBS 8797 / KCTC 17520 / NBRC 10181 / NCYC 3082 / Yp74L-3) TaxID=1071383 RepID=J7S3W9_HUIN7|nr:hypothetical protein KNAG_0A05720 [Kazachstania naganishii CBS 8797]CCK68236.1 hypothetical protein KNAG_0A05720 [Kazachstania naganishii CBS 8797]
MFEKGNSVVGGGEDPVPPVELRDGPVRKYLVTDPPADLHKLRAHRSLFEKATDSRTCDGYMCGASVQSWLSRQRRVRRGAFWWVCGGVPKGYLFYGRTPSIGQDAVRCRGRSWWVRMVNYLRNIGTKFPSDVPYAFMRTFSAVCGSMTVLLMYFTLRFSGVSIAVAFLAAVCFIVENSYVTISRYILLDAPMMFFIAFAVYSFKRFELYPQDSWAALRSLALTGVGLGFAASSKWVGLFTVAWIGLLCIWRLWFMVGDLSKSPRSILKSAVWKLVCLLGIPVVIYIASFYVHFQILTKEGDGASFFSSGFRSTLEGNAIPQGMLADVGITSTVTFKHPGTMGGYLHSHSHMYETGSEQQQITLYPHLDDNNKWIIELSNFPGATLPSFQNLTDGTSIRLLHSLTHCRLHSHDHKAPVSQFADWQKEVSCYGYTGFEGDGNDDWILEIDKDASTPGPAQERVVALDTKFRLRHALTGCFLFSHEVQLPEWGFEQQEVTCATQGKPHLTLWYIEDNVNPLLPKDAPRTSYRLPGFWEKLVESHSKMWHINKNLVESHVYASMPYTWPLMTRGISYVGEENRAVYLLGNAIMWWSVSLFVVLFTGLVAAELLAWQVGKPILQDTHVVNFHVQVIHYLLGFAVHFAPSFLMQRQMFLHHYLPAYYFGILALAQALDLVANYVFKRNRTFGVAFVVAFTLSCIYFFNTFKPLTYGTPWTKEECLKTQWLSNWDYNCHSFLDTYEEYNQVSAVSPE